MPDFDVIVLGGGSAGTSAARSATLAGARTALINDGELGGLCILRGCMPSKAMLASAHVAHEARHAGAFGVKVAGAVKADFARVVSRKNEQVARFQRAKVANVKRQDYEVIFGRGRFAAGGGVEVDGRRLTAHRYVIATGSRPVRLPLPGSDAVPVWTSDDVMRLERQPRRLVVYGAGPIGLELAQLFARLDTEVLLVNRSPLLSRYDADCGAELARALAAEESLRLQVPGRVAAVEPAGDEALVRIESEGAVIEERADALLVAAGRRALLDDLGLEHVGLEAQGGRLEHDDAMRTANPEVYIAGDATDQRKILHVANEEGEVAGHNAAVGAAERRVDTRLKMIVVFTDPPFAQVGMTIGELEAAERPFSIGMARFPETGRAITMETRFGLWKLVVDRESGEIVGSAILGPRADDLVHTVAAMMYYRGHVQDIHEMPWYHPTLSEVAINLARDLAGQFPRAERPTPPPA
jgi:pyruvate/2-oxoglutarate dehydrogenase complex dihydrolipoamide dehydrogenase (E3) component